MVGDGEITIVDPNQTPAPPGNLHQPLAQARDGSDSMGNRVQNEPGIQTLGSIQHQHCPDLHRLGPALGCQGHQIVRSCPLNRVREHFLTLSEMAYTGE